MAMHHTQMLLFAIMCDRSAWPILFIGWVAAYART